jgi:hypothetical protein
LNVEKTILREGGAAMGVNAVRAGELSKKGAAQLVHAPLMITLPTAYLVARYIFSQTFGLAPFFSALLTALLIYGVDWYADEEKWGVKAYGGRLFYAIFNTAILMGVLSGEIEVDIPS